ncbi:hypothetical protein GCM10022388_23090 [Flavobacterium chungnamense]|uniref:Uncharacterized protein n=1 Tax=Flavobacterium chungnamense TaxID=706182 RepID=A0ABP7UZ48_9FLAO
MLFVVIYYFSRLIIVNKTKRVLKTLKKTTAIPQINTLKRKLHEKSVESNQIIYNPNVTMTNSIIDSLKTVVNCE